MTRTDRLDEHGRYAAAYVKRLALTYLAAGILFGASLVGTIVSIVR